MSWLTRKKMVPVLSPLEGYNRWADTYSSESNPIKNLSDNLVEKFLPDLQGKSLLDVGCGTGKFCVTAQQKHATRIVGIDLSPFMIDLAKQHCPAAEFRSGDLSALELRGEKFDVIICALVLGHLEKIEPALSTLVNALTKNGVLIITDFHPFLTMMKLKRTFKDRLTGKTFEIQHHLHLFQDYLRCLTNHDMIVDRFEEPLHENTPVVFGLRATRK